MANLALLGSPLAITSSADVSQWTECARTAPVFAAMRTADSVLVLCPSDVAQGEVWRAFRVNSFSSLSEILRPVEEGRLRVRLAYLDKEALLLVPASEVERAITALTRAGHQVETPQDELIEVKCSWRMPDGGRAHAAFLARVVTYDSRQDRWLVRLQDVHLLSPADETSQALIQSKVGSWVWVPSEARQGMTLPLKYETLTGRIRWFYARDPRAED